MATTALKKALRRDPTLHEDINEFPTLVQIFKTIQEGKINASMQ